MISLTRPDEQRLERLRQSCRDRPLTYAEVGASRGEPPPGYVVDCNRVRLGSGRETFDRASAAVRTWVPLRLGWVEPSWPRAEIAVGEVVGTLARYGGLWWVNPCRIVVIEDRTTDDGRRRYGFSYGTLLGHIERGEEGFTVEWDPADDSVWYEIFAFSSPGRWISRLAYPLVRRQQKRFAADSLRAMVLAVGPAPSAREQHQTHRATRTAMG